jgi:hypothetical protein
MKTTNALLATAKGRATSHAALAIWLVKTLLCAHAATSTLAKKSVAYVMEQA